MLRWARLPVDVNGVADILIGTTKERDDLRQDLLRRRLQTEANTHHRQMSTLQRKVLRDRIQRILLQEKRRRRIIKDPHLFQDGTAAADRNKKPTFTTKTTVIKI